MGLATPSQRVAIILPWFDETQNSFSMLVEPMVQRLVADGHEVVIFSGNLDYAGPWQAIHRPIKGVPPRPAFLKFLIFLILSTLAVRRASRIRPFAIVHNHGCGSTLRQNVITAHACHAAWLRQKLIYGRFWTVFANPLHALVIAVEWWNYRQANTEVIAVSESVKQEVIRHYRLLEGRVTVVHNALLDTCSGPIQHDTSHAKELRIGFAGNAFGHKGLGVLLDALHLACIEKKRDWLLLVMGHDSAIKRWQRRVDKLGLSQVVCFTGHVTDLDSRLSNLDVFCMPSRYESFGLVYLQAARRGVPIVATPVGIMPTLSRQVQGLAEIQVPHPPNKYEILDRLQRVADNKLFFKQMGLKLRDAASKFEVNTMVEETLQVYAKAASKAV